MKNVIEQMSTEDMVRYVQGEEAVKRRLRDLLQAYHNLLIENDITIPSEASIRGEVIE